MLRIDINVIVVWHISQQKHKGANMEEIKALLDSLVNTCLRASNSAEEVKDEEKDEEEAKNKKACNEDVDKRDIIRQIMAIAGKEEASEDVKTIAKLAEKLAYDKSEAGTADNCGKKAKNEEDKKAVKPAENEEEVEEEIKEEEAENKKAKNSIDESVNNILNAVSGMNQPKYETQIDRLELGNKY